MCRTTTAATLALALLSLTAVEAAASPLSSYATTYRLQCSAGQTDGESLKANQTIIKNTSGRIIPKGTKITIGYNNSFGRIRIVTVIAYRDVNINETIPMGSSGVYARCSASVTIWPQVTKIIRR